MKYDATQVTLLCNLQKIGEFNAPNKTENQFSYYKVIQVWLN